MHCVVVLVRGQLKGFGELALSFHHMVPWIELRLSSVAASDNLLSHLTRCEVSAPDFAAENVKTGPV